MFVYVHLKKKNYSNSNHQQIQFNLEDDDPKTLSFLDILITKTTERKVHQRKAECYHQPAKIQAVANTSI